jgi:hypothetical protein
MNNSSYRVVPLSTSVAEAARNAANAGVCDHVVVTADAPDGYPCRHCLRWAQPGERMVLFPFASIAPGQPYSEIGPIFVHDEPCERYRLTAEFPADFRGGRAIRAYNSNQTIIAAEVANGNTAEAVIERLLQNPETDFIQVRSASHGCYTMGIERV